MKEEKIIINVDANTGEVEQLGSALDKTATAGSKASDSVEDLGDSLKKTDKEISKTETGLKKNVGAMTQMRKEIKGLKDRLLELDDSSIEYKQTLQEVANKTLQLKDMNDAVRVSAMDLGAKIENVGKVLQGAAGIYQVGAGMTALFGEENEALAESMQKLMAVMSIVQGLQGLEGLTKSIPALISNFKEFKGSIDGVTDGSGKLTVGIDGASDSALALNSSAETLGAAGIVSAGKNMDLLNSKVTQLEKNLNGATLALNFQKSALTDQRFTKTAADQAKWNAEIKKTEANIQRITLELNAARAAVSKATTQTGLWAKAVGLVKLAVNGLKAALGPILLLFLAFEGILWIFQKLGDLFSWAGEKLQTAGKEAEKLYTELDKINKTNEFGFRIMKAQGKEELEILEAKIKANKALADAAEANYQRIKNARGLLYFNKKYDEDSEEYKKALEEKEKYTEKYTATIQDYQVQLTQEATDQRKKDLEDAKRAEEEKTRIAKEGAKKRADELKKLKDWFNQYLKEGPAEEEELDVDPFKEWREKQAQEAEWEKQIQEDTLKEIRRLQSEELDAMLLEEINMRNNMSSWTEGWQTSELEKLNAYEQKRLELKLEYLKRERDAIIRNGGDVTDINKEISSTQIDIAEAENNAKKKLTVGAAQDFLSSLEGIAEENTVMAKGLASTQTAIDTYAGAMAAYKSLAGIPLVGPGLGIAAAAGVTAAGVMSIKKIWAADKNDTVADSPAAEIVPPNITYTSNQMTQTELDLQKTNNRVYVLESDITATQGRVAKVQQSSTF